MSETVTGQERARIERLSGVMSWVALVFAAFAVITGGLVLWFADAQTLLTSAGLQPPSETQAPDHGLRLALLAVNLPASLLTGYALWRLSAAFRAFSQGDFFGRTGLLALRGFAIALLLSVIVDVVGNTVSSIMLSLWLTGQGAVAIMFGTTELFAIATAGLFWVIAAILAEAARLEDENRQFV